LGECAERAYLIERAGRRVRGGLVVGRGGDLKLGDGRSGRRRLVVRT
jgi:hypothetical protein